MKNMKKFASVLVAIVLVLAMSVPAFAAGQTGSITINNVNANDAFKAYKILDATAIDAANPNNGITYSIPTEMEGFYADYFSVDESDMNAVIEKINELKDNGEALQAFAKAALAWAKEKSVAPETVTVDAGETSAKFENISYGYYVIEDATSFAEGDENKVVSALMLDTTNSEPAIDVKRELPTVDKKVNDVNDSTGADEGWKDTADHDIGDEVKFQLTGTVAKNVALYEKYSYKFVDTLSDGLTLNEDSIKVYIDGKEVAAGYNTIVTGQTFEVSFEDLKAATVKTENGGTETATITAETKVVVEYTATLNENAVIGKDGNTNKVHLEYSNNPNGTGTGKTPEDIVTVYTYELKVTKTDGNDQPLAGAGFTLYKYNYSTEEWEAVGEEKLTAIVDGAAIVNWKGLDDGKYKIVETTVPTGYNKAKDIEFEIVASIDGDSKILVAGDLSVDVDNGLISTTVVNKTGSLLPETGGMGTTMFYVLGGLLVVGAAILLVTKKRMAYEA